MKKTFIPEEFREKYSKIMGKESDTFFEYCKIKMPKSIWINSLKIKPEILVKELREKEWILEKLFHENAYSLKIHILRALSRTRFNLSWCFS